MKKRVTAYNRLPDKCAICKTPADEDFCSACIEKYPEKIEKIKIYWNLKHHTTWGLLNKSTLEYPEPVITALRVYRLTKYLREMPVYDELSKNDKLPTRTLKAIQNELNKLKTEYIPKGDKMRVKRRWLESEDVDEIMAFIKNKIKQGPKWKNTLQAMERTTRPPDISLNLLIFLLAKYIKRRRHNIDWQEISIFLKTDEGITIDSAKLRERHKKVDKKKLRKHYETYRDRYPHKDKTSELLRDIHLPKWKNLLY